MNVVAVTADDPLLAEVVEHVLARHGIRVVQDGAALTLRVDAEAIEILSDGVVTGALGRPFWEHELVAALTTPPAPRAWRPRWCALAAMLSWHTAAR